MIVAGSAAANECIFVADNERDFGGLNVLNPLRRVIEGARGRYTQSANCV